MADVFPPKVPCPGECEYGACQGGCGGCCYCFGECHQEWDIRHMYIPETREQHEAQPIPSHTADGEPF